MFYAIVSQSSSSMTERKGNKNSENAHCHKLFGRNEVGNVGEVEARKIGKVQVGKLGTAQLGNLDKPTNFNEMEPHVGTIEEKLINSTTKQRIKLLPKRGRLFKLSPFYDPDNKVVRVGGRLANLHTTLTRIILS